MRRRGADAAVIARIAVGPDDHLAAVALLRGIGLDGRAWTDIGAQRILDVRVLALVIPADQHRTAARRARGVDLRRVDQADLVAEQLDVPPVPPRRAPRCCRRRAGCRPAPAP